MPLRLFLFFFLSFLIPNFSLAEEIYQKPNDFVQEAFDGKPPEADYIWITKEIRPQVNKIMEHRYPLIKIKYWLKDGRSVWILEEIGKVKLITTGFIVNKDGIEFLKILVYRESHGKEVREDFFTQQFTHATLIDDEKLSQPIDNISGATMSVDAVRNLGKLALYLHKQVINEKREE